MARSVHCHTTFSEDKSDFFDTDHLRCSSHAQKDINDECLKFSIGDSNRIADSQGSSNLESILVDSKISATLCHIFLEDLNHMVDSTPLECGSMSFDFIKDQEDKSHQLRYNNINIRRGSCYIRQSQPRTKRIQVNDVNFDPTPHSHRQYQQRLSYNDTSVVMETSSHTTEPSNYNSQPSYCLQGRIKFDSGMPPGPRQHHDRNRRSGMHQEYQEALKKLTQSMERTKSTCQQLEIQRTIINAAALP